MYDRETNGGYPTIASLGFNLIDSGPGDVSDLAGGLKGFVWVGDYTNCAWEISDTDLAAQVRAHVGDPKVGVWFISDEPDVSSCPNVYRQHADRAALIHSIDPNAKTLVVLDSNSAAASLEQLPHWRGAVNCLALDPSLPYRAALCLRLDRPERARRHRGTPALVRGGPGARGSQLRRISLARRPGRDAQGLPAAADARRSPRAVSSLARGPDARLLRVRLAVAAG
jgi:hypothetical protein